jgi:hypothetical protein
MLRLSPIIVGNEPDISAFSSGSDLPRLSVSRSDAVLHNFTPVEPISCNKNKRVCVASACPEHNSLLSSNQCGDSEGFGQSGGWRVRACYCAHLVEQSSSPHLDVGRSELRWQSGGWRVRPCSFDHLLERSSSPHLHAGRLT